LTELQPLVRDNIRLAATVMLLRQGEGGDFEVYMVQRPGRGDFPDLHVFPGGKVDEADYAPDICFGLEDQVASEVLGVAAGGLRYWVAVARECFEECGVLLVRRDGQPVVFEDSTAARFHNYREDLLADKITFAEICTAESLQVDCSRLGYFSHWITPEMAPRRFDTRFFVAAMPTDQATLAHTIETADDEWEKPAVALANKDNGLWQMIDPTLRSLETLSQYESVEQALAKIQQGNHLMPLTDALSRQGMQPLR
jgi:8-oxo-dGTP pyrophosphatase MutT (NUDIX family)